MVTMKVTENGFAGMFEAMNCPCEVIVEGVDQATAERLIQLASQEAFRIESKFSRYCQGNIVDRINRSEGRPIEVDGETAHLLDFANQCFQLSGGLFDITSGVLRKTSLHDVKDVLPLVGWSKVTWNNPLLTLRAGMEIDFGGIGKEYAVDRVLKILTEQTDAPVLVNFGGDIAVSGERRGGEPWLVGIEDVSRENLSAELLRLSKGALATSGTTKRPGHILDPGTGRPVADTPRSVTVAAPTCTEAGFFSTVGILNGRNAERFLSEAGVQHWCHI